LNHTPVRPTTFIAARRLSERIGTDVVLASETFQHTGSFKFRAAYHVACSVGHDHILTASSGNFGQAMAYACRLLGKRSTIVMPSTSAQVKVDAVREYGGAVELVDVRTKSRAERVAELASQYPEAYVASAYDDDLVIEGNASLGEELADVEPWFDVVVAPVGGGGLTAGIISGLRRSGCTTRVIGAEPLLANDAARSLREGRLVANELEPQTIADGARTVSLGERNWAILNSGLEAVVEVDEDHIMEAVRMLFCLTNLKSEPTGALGVGALISQPQRFKGQRVCCVVSGGNVDPSVYCDILS